MPSVTSVCFLISLLTLLAKAQGSSGGWGNWSVWSSCTRSCGVGISQQLRSCSYKVSGKPLCQGASVQYKTCNTQDCPEGAKDFRSEQCAIFNDRPFRGRLFQWKPYIPGYAQCVLHCMPSTRGFYVNMAPKVIDGTICDKDPYNICVNGKCLAMGCDRVLGSNAKEDNCRVCNGNNRNCKTQKGRYDKTGDGYKEFLVLPRGSTYVRIQEVGYSDHFLAMADSSGRYLFNGDYRIVNSKEIAAAGTMVEYRRVFRSPETIFIKGPLTEPLHAVILLRGRRIRNPGVIYEFSLPSSMKTHPPTTNTPTTTSSTTTSWTTTSSTTTSSTTTSSTTTYSWSTSAYTRCTASCAGGQQRRAVVCLRNRDGVRVEERNCNPTTKPKSIRKCNSQPCPARWRTSGWGVCSRTCGRGQQFRQVKCMHITNSFQREALPDDRCPGPKPNNVRLCQGSAKCPTWFTGQWSACSATCGAGTRSRDVSCVAGVADNSVRDPQSLPDSTCSPAPKPSTTEQCNRGPCTGKWLASNWTQCYSRCGRGVSTRIVHCVSVTDLGKRVSERLCDLRTRPQSQTQCINYDACPPMWLGSKWSACSTTCGGGIQTRKVMCLRRTGPKALTELVDNKCNKTEKLAVSRRCYLQPCKARWDTSPWQQCSRTCGVGVQRRVVKCIADSKEDSTKKRCDKKPKPSTERRCFLEDCRTTTSPTTKPTTVARIITTAESTTLPALTTTATRSNNSPARIIEAPRNIVDVVGRNVIFRCRAVGIPTPTITWRKGRDQLRQSSKHQIYRDGTLRIESISLNDAARYTCIAFNGVSSPATSSANLVVNDPPRVRISGATSVFEGSRVLIRCSITGTPRPIANWYKDGIVLVSNLRSTVTRTSVTIYKAQLSDSGTYECRAVHDNGRDKGSLTLTVQRRPTPTSTAACKDHPNLANCIFVKRSGFCRYDFYQKACCSTCTRQDRRPRRN